MTEADRWEPDHQLIPAFLVAPRPELKLSVADRAWVVAGLTLAGKTAEDIAERLGVSLRLIRSIRSEPMTQVCTFYQTEVEMFANELRLATSERRTAELELDDERKELERTRTQLANLIAVSKDQVFEKCGHAMDRYNTYFYGKRKYCRTCHRASEQKRRDAKSCQQMPTAGHDGS